MKVQLKGLVAPRHRHRHVLSSFPASQVSLLPFPRWTPVDTLLIENRGMGQP